MLEMHDLDKLGERGFSIKEEICLDQLDGVSAYLSIDDSIRIQVYQGCQGIYELQGQGRGRPKKDVLVKYEWFTPTWYVAEKKNGEWVDVDHGYSDSVDDAVSAVLARVREMYPSMPPTTI
jgi:hypothetical protein